MLFALASFSWLLMCVVPWLPVPMYATTMRSLAPSTRPVAGALPWANTDPASRRVEAAATATPAVVRMNARRVWGAVRPGGCLLSFMRCFLRVCGRIRQDSRGAGHECGLPPILRERLLDPPITGAA